MSWISVDTPPETKGWVIGMTQDGTVYPVTYNEAQKYWSPVFRGGHVESLMHGKIIYWQSAPEGYQYVMCEHKHRYLQTPDTPVCPLCKSFGFVQSAPEPKTVDAKTTRKPRAKKED